MEVADTVLLRLADPVARAAVLDRDALLAVLAVCYDLDPASVVGPVTAAYDRVDVAVPTVPSTAVALRVTRAGDALPWEITGSWEVPSVPLAGADLVWAGSIVAAVGGGSGVVEDVTVTGAAPDAAGHDRLDVGLRFSAPTDPQPSAPITMPVVVAFVVGDAASSPRALLLATGQARRAARGYPAPPPPAQAPPRRTARCVCWVLPVAAFDDVGWPAAAGADRAARLAAARAWLATQGIAVVTTA